MLGGYQEDKGVKAEQGRENSQEVREDIRDKDAERIYVTVLLEEIVQVLKLGK
jgi:hypothetical protein